MIMSIKPNRVHQLIEGEAMIHPKQDYMLLKKHEKKTKIHLINEQATNTIVFEILDIGPGRWEFGKFIETTHKKGDMVFIVGNVAELHYNDIVPVMGREKDLIAVVEK
jgi:hypothetical protein